MNRLQDAQGRFQRAPEPEQHPAQVRPDLQQARQNRAHLQNSLIAFFLGVLSVENLKSVPYELLYKTLISNVDVLVIVIEHIMWFAIYVLTYGLELFFQFFLSTFIVETLMEDNGTRMATYLRILDSPNLRPFSHVSEILLFLGWLKFAFHFDFDNLSIFLGILLATMIGLWNLRPGNVDRALMMVYSIELVLMIGSSLIVFLGPKFVPLFAYDCLVNLSIANLPRPACLFEVFYRIYVWYFYSGELDWTIAVHFLAFCSATLIAFVL